jgi:hypothetical protein
MTKICVLILAALALTSAAPADAPALPAAALRLAPRPALVVPGRVEISGEVNGQHRLGYTVSLGVYTAYGATLEEAAQNACALEQQIRQTATAQAAR